MKKILRNSLLAIIMAALIAPTTVSAKMAPPPPPTGSSHPIGTNVVMPDGTVYRITAGPKRKAYASAEIFLSYKFNNWADVEPATSGDMALTIDTVMPPRDGSLWNYNGTVYIVSEGKAQQPFGSAEVFKGYGYSFSNVYTEPTDFFGNGSLEIYPTMTSSELIHPDGTLIEHQGTYFIMNSHARLGVPSQAILESWGYWLNDAVEANSYDLATPVTAVLGMRPFDQYRY